MNPPLPRAPNDSDRLVIVGQTGTGKTVIAAYWLSGRSWGLPKEQGGMPWIVANYKNDEYLNLLGAEEISAHSAIPNEPGLYMVRPECEEGSLDPILEKMHRRAIAGGGGCGILIDEGYEVGPRSKPLRKVLTQGRSLRLPTIILSQRPVWMSRFVFSEATYVQALPLMDIEDRRIVTKWLPNKTIFGVPVDINYPETLPEFSSLYYDAGKRRLITMGPVPFGEEVLKVFEERRPRRVQKVGSKSWLQLIGRSKT